MGEEKKSNIQINTKWCKSCGICYALCPKGALGKDELGRAVMVNPDSCSRCGICEDHCPDYCIKIGG